MLRITIHDQAPVTSFVVEGKLVGPWVKELEKCWERELAADPSRTMLVNLVAVTFIDSEGRDLLARMIRDGAELRATGVMTRAVIEEIAEMIAMAPGGRTQAVSGGLDANDHDNS